MVWVVVAEGVAIALLGVLVLGLLRSHALILKALHELGAGLDLEDEAGGGAGHGGPPGAVPVQIEPGVVPATRASSSTSFAVVGVDLEGGHAAVEVDGPRPVLLAFLSSGCSVCLTFWEELDATTRAPADARVVVVVKDAPDESPTVLARLARPGVSVVASSAAWADYDIPGSPYFVLVEQGVVTGEGSATSWAAVSDLLAQAVDESAHARAAAGRSGPGILDRGDRDDLGRIDAELLAAGITPGHPSLHTPPDPDVPDGPRG
ncbi:TlpA family protein disulfide reductase [Phycicoccus avicenniae]|uniref:TlpA family protein disulfide reductase n=1 Tax=Phycicoccus avicenniae TaxID=2828860 RepID=UPI003D2E43E5